MNNLMRNKCSSDDDWPIYEVEILRYCDTLEKARKAAENTDYTSSEEKLLGRGRRQKRFSNTVIAANNNKKRIKTNSESSDEDIHQNPKMPSAPKLPTFHGVNSDLHLDKTLQQSMDDTNKKLSTSDEEDDSTNSTITTESTINYNMLEEEVNYENNYDGCEKQIRNAVPIDNNNVCYQRLRKVEVNTNASLYLLGRVLVEIRDLKQHIMTLNSSNTFTSSDSTILDKIKKYLPLRSEEVVTEFQQFLSESEENHRAFLQIIDQVGGANGEDYTKRVLELLFSPSFARGNTWEGKKTKYCVKSLTLIAIVDEMILKKFPNWNSAEFGKTGLNWFRLGNQRSGNQPGQLQKKKLMLKQ